MGIENHLKTIKEGVLGRDVRKAIHDGIKQAYDDASQNGNANMEVALARGLSDNLSDRLDSMESKDSETMSRLLLEASRINNLIANAGNGTIPSELSDIRVGADKITYATAGEAIRKQFLELTKTLSSLNDSLNSAVDAGLAGYDYVEQATTNIDTSSMRNSVTGPSQAYECTYRFEESVAVTGIVLDPRITTTTFSFFVLNSDNQVIDSILNVSPEITKHQFSLPRRLVVQSGGKFLVQFSNGTIYYHRASSNDYIEYRPGTKSAVASPVAGAFNVIYKKTSVSFATGVSDKANVISLSDYKLPKFEEVEGQYYLHGRWFKKSDDSQSYDATNNQGSLIFCKVKGANTLTVGLKPFTEPRNPYFFAYSIDGGAFVRRAFSDNVIQFDNSDEHIVQIVLDGIGENDPVAGGKWSSRLGVYLTQMAVDSGTITAIKPLNKKGLFIGDSITEGINVLMTGAVGSSNSASNAYPFVASKHLNSIPYLVGYGGTGVSSDASFHRAIEAIDYFYNNVLSNTAQIDYVVMAHGYNDYSLIKKGTLTPEQFKTAYGAVLDRLSVKYSGSPIFCVVPFGAQALKPHIEACVNSRSNCYLITSANWSITTTDGTHPDVEGSKTLGKNIATEIQRILTKQYFMN